MSAGRIVWYVFFGIRHLRVSTVVLRLIRIAVLVSGSFLPIAENSPCGQGNKLFLYAPSAGHWAVLRYHKQSCHGHSYTGLAVP